LRALVTGANGFLGAHVVRALLERETEVRALVRKGADLRALEGLPVDLAVGDVRDPAAVIRAVDGCSYVFHVAALYAFWVRPRSAIYEINVDGTRNVLQAALEAGVERVVHTSSVAALGTRDDGAPADETTPVDTRRIIGDYKRSKYLAEQVALEFAERMEVVVVNPSLPIGPWDAKPTPSGQIVLDFLRRRLPAYVDTGFNVVDARDVGLGHVLAAERGQMGERYILGGENISMKHMLGLLGEITGLPVPRVRLPVAPMLGLAHLNAGLCRMTRRTPRLTPDTIRMARHAMYFDSGKARRELGYPESSARKALSSAVAWYREHGFAD